MTPEPLSFLIAGVAGLALGSFTVTAGVRIGRGQGIVHGRSQCDHCGVALSYAQTVPVISHWRQKGVCRRCGGRIDPIHLVGEVAGAAILVASAGLMEPTRGVMVAGLGLLLIASAATDWSVRRLPDLLTLGVAVLGLGLSASASHLGMIAGVVAAVLSFLILQGLRLLNTHRGRDPGLGFGDVKLIAALSLWLGALTPWMIVGAALLGLLLMRWARPSDGKLAFGPSIALASFVIGLSSEYGLWPTTV